MRTPEKWRPGGAAVVMAIMLLACSAGTAQARAVVTWVDAHGVTHFGDPQFAPERHERLDVQPTNGMVVHSTVDDPGPTHPRFITIERARLKNLRGFQGYAKRPRDKRRYRR